MERASSLTSNRTPHHNDGRDRRWWLNQPVEFDCNLVAKLQLAVIAIPDYVRK